MSSSKRALTLEGALLLNEQQSSKRSQIIFLSFTSLSPHFVCARARCITEDERRNRKNGSGLLCLPSFMVLRGNMSAEVLKRLGFYRDLRFEPQSQSDVVWSYNVYLPAQR